MSRTEKKQIKTNIGEVLALEKSLEDFVVTFANSLIKLEIIRFFAGNHFACNNAEGVARCIGRKQVDIEDGLKNLSKVGLIDKITRDEDSAYCFTTDAEIQRKVDLFLENLNDRTTRLKVVSRILHIEAKHDVS